MKKRKMFKQTKCFYQTKQKAMYKTQVSKLLDARELKITTMPDLNEN